jgi:YesN/AraC family two-component response regulator
MPDLVISDIMMPKLDGFQFCRKLKTDVRTSHIPVILVTAKATMDDKINGLGVGADEYIMKPFEAAELKARVDNLLAQRRRLHEYFRQHGHTAHVQEKITSADQKFLNRAMEVMQEHLSDTSFGVEAFAEKMAVSRSLLLKKLDALTGEPPSELIRRTRLQQAARLLEARAGNVSEVALEVGFNNPSYFAECFRKQFGVSPARFRPDSRHFPSDGEDPHLP